MIASHYHRIRKVDTSRTITTVAGTGRRGSFSGDGDVATSSGLDTPSSVAVDANGNLFIVDTGNHRIRKVDPSGIITTVAGNGTLGFSGDGGSATDAAIGYAPAVVVDAAGNLFLADYDHHRIRKVDASGIITTVAGNGTEAFRGDGGPASDATLASPTGLAFDATGNLYVADTGHHRVRKVDTSGIISTVAGSGAAGFTGDGGPATSAGLIRPFGLAVDPAGNFYFSDKWGRVRKVGTSASSPRWRETGPTTASQVTAASPRTPT